MTLGNHTRCSLTCDHSDLQNRFDVSEARSTDRGPWEALMNVNTPAFHFSLWLRMDRGLPIGLDINRPAS